MADNQYVNKVIYGEEAILDLTQDTVDPSHLLLGYTAHDKSGAIIIGTYDSSSTAVDSLEIVKSPNKTEFTIHEELDYTGIEIVAYTEDGFIKDVTNDVVFDPTEGIMIPTVGTQTVTISYRGVTTTFLIVVTEGEYNPPTWGGGTDADIRYALQKHYKGEIDIYDYWNVGDTRTVQMSSIENPDGTVISEQTLELKLVSVGGRTLTTPIKEISTCAFTVQIASSELGSYPVGLYTSNSIDWSSKRIRTWCNSTFLDNLPNNTIFKEYVSPYLLNGRSQQVDDYISLLQGTDVEGASKLDYYTPSNIPSYSKSFESRDSTSSNSWVLIWTGNGSKVNYNYIRPGAKSLDRVVLLGCI